MAGSSNPPNRPGSNLAHLRLSSGSTAAPEVTAIGQDNALANLETISHGFGLRPQWSGLSSLPPHHDTGLVGGVLAPPVTDHRIVGMTPGDFARSSLDWLTLMARIGAETSGGPNFAVDLCARRLADSTDALPPTCPGGGLPVAAARRCGRRRSNGPPPRRRGPASIPAVFLPCDGMVEATLFVSGLRGAPAGRGAGFDAAVLERGDARPAGP